MENVIFAFGPNNSYFYNTPKQWARRGMPSEIEQLFVDGDVSDVKWAAFGPRTDSYFMSYVRKDGTEIIVWGDGLPSKFRSWLRDEATDKLNRDGRVKVVLGPDDSFFAWDGTSVRWSDIPSGLEDAVQGWLSPSGWSEGAPRIVALGCNGSYFALSDYGAAAWSIPDSFTVQKAAWEAYKADKSFKWSNLIHVSFDSCQPGQFLCISKDDYTGDIPEPLDTFYTVIDSLASEEVRKSRLAERNRQKAEAARKAEEAARKAEEAAKKQRESYNPFDYQERAKRAAAAEARARAAREKNLENELPQHYAAWVARYKKDFNSTAPLTAFPHLPTIVCTCNLTGCAERKKEQGALLACRHDVERLLRSNSAYSAKWLKEERLAWHPDRFGRRCDVDFRRELNKKATELFAIFEVLIHEEDGKAAE